MMRERTRRPEGPPAPRRRYVLDAIAVFAVVFGAFCWRLGEGPLSRTEPHRALVAHQMVESGDWLIPRLWGERYLAKPPLHYWAVALAERLCGVASEWVWRLPSALASAATATLVCIAANRWFGRPAGVIAGGSYLGLVALWSQSTKADVDATHTLAVVGVALGLLELGRSRRLLVGLTLLTGVALGGALLIKGPAGLPVVVGAMLGPLVLERRGRVVRPGAAACVLSIGLLLFGAWALAVHAKVGVGRTADDLQGVQEGVARTLRFDAARWLGAVAVPAILFVHAVPVSLLACCAGSAVRAAPEGRPMVRALGATIATAMLVGILAGIDNPRYMLIVLPLICPIVGFVGWSWVNGPGGPTSLGSRAFTISLAIVAVAHLALTVSNWARTGSVPIVAAIAAAGALAVCAASLKGIRAGRTRAALAGSLGAILLVRLPFAELKVSERLDHSSRQAGLMLRAIVGRGAVVSTDRWVMTDPGLFHYADVEVRYVRNQLGQPRSFPGDRWILFDGDEWPVWRDSPFSAHFDQAVALPAPGRDPVLAHYSRVVTTDRGHAPPPPVRMPPPPPLR